MKVAHFIDTKNVVGGAEVLVVEVCRNLKKFDVESIVFHFGNTWIAKKCSQYGITSKTLPGYRYYKSIKTIPFFAFVLRRFLKDADIDILHSHLVDSITGACLGTYFSRTPHVGTLHDVHTLEEQPAKIWLLQCATFFGTRMITVSRDVEHYIMQNILFFKGKYKTIYNGIDMERFVLPDNINAQLRKSLGLSEDDFVFICVGRLAEIKDHVTLIKAFAKCQFDHTVKLLIVGDGPFHDAIAGQSLALQVDEPVKMLGLRDDIPELLNISDCFVLSSRSEGLSCSIIEAMSAGLPSVVTDVGGNPELIEDGINGYLVPPNNPATLATQMRKIYTNVDIRKKMAECTKIIACEQFSIDSMLRKYVSVYEQMVRGKR